MEELHGPVLSLLMPYMGEGDFKGRYILRPGPVTLVDEQLLQHFGRILGLGLRSGIPLPLDLVPTFWFKCYKTFFFFVTCASYSVYLRQVIPA